MTSRASACAPDSAMRRQSFVLAVRDPDKWAAFFWDAGLTVHLHKHTRGRTYSVIDRFGRRIELIRRTRTMRRHSAPDASGVDSDVTVEPTRLSLLRKPNGYSR